MRSQWFGSNHNPQPAPMAQPHGPPPADNRFHEQHHPDHVHQADAHAPPGPPHAPPQHGSYRGQGGSPQMHSQQQQRQHQQHQQHPYHVPTRGVMPSGHSQGDPSRQRRSPEIGSRPYPQGPPMPPQHSHMRSQQPPQPQFRPTGPPMPPPHHSQQPMRSRGPPPPPPPPPPPRNMRQYVPPPQQGPPPSMAHHHNPHQQQMEKMEHGHHHVATQQRGPSSSPLKENRSHNIQRATKEVRPLVKPPVMPPMHSAPSHRMAPPPVDTSTAPQKPEPKKIISSEQSERAEQPTKVISRNSSDDTITKEKRNADHHPESEREMPPQKPQLKSRKLKNLFGLRDAASILLGMKLEPSPKSSDSSLLSSPFQQHESIPGVQLIDSANTEDTENEDDIPVEYPTRLALPEDGSKLNSMHCFLRSELLELFVLENTKSSTSKAGNNKSSPTAAVDASPQCPPAKQRSTATPSASGRVGLRCVHCAFARQARRTAQQKRQQEQGGATVPKAFDPQFLQNSEAPMAVFYPKSISELYRLVTSWQRVHLRKCKNLPPSVRETYQSIRETDKTRGKTHYWTTSAAKLGLIDCPSKAGGIRFYSRKNNSDTANSPNNSSTNNSTVNEIVTVA